MPKKSDVHLTKTVVDGLPTSRDLVVFDDELRGFGVRVKPGGTKTYLVQYRNAEGRSRRLSLGQHGALTCAEARKAAITALGRVAAGEDPAVERDEDRRALTVAALGDAYFAAAERGEVRSRRGAAKKASTLRIDKLRWERHIKPLLGGRRARSLTRTDVREFLAAADRRAREAGYRGAGERRLKGLLGGMLAFAMELGIVEANPCLGVKTRPDGRRKVALDAAGYRTLGRMLDEAEMRGEPWQAIGAIRLLALTGARRGEIAHLRWREVDLAGQALRLGDTKTGASVRPIGQHARDVLKRVMNLPTSGSVFVFPSERRARGGTGGEDNPRPFELAKAFRRICGGLRGERGELVTPHGLRHAFASVANGCGMTEATIAAMIGHAAGSVTGRYTHALDAVLLAATDAVAAQIAEWMAEGAKEARGCALMTIADVNPADEELALRALAVDVMTKALPHEMRAALAKPLSTALGFWRTTLPARTARAKPAEWALDVLIRDCRRAFEAQGLKVGIWADDRGDSPFLSFVDRLAKASVEAPRSRE
jgi:integrase